MQPSPKYRFSEAAVTREAAQNKAEQLDSVLTGKCRSQSMTRLNRFETKFLKEFLYSA